MVSSTNTLAKRHTNYSNCW